MKIIVESGATKSDWRLLGEDGRQLKRILTGGINVSAMKMEVIRQTISDVLSSEGISELEGIYLYVAGVVTDAIRTEIETFVRSLVQVSDFDIQDDLTAAARAVFGKSTGVVAILGTGSNSCWYDGSAVFRKVRSGGYILGDEGSAATLGRLFIADFLKELVPSDIAEDFASNFDSSYAGIVENVYRGASPSAYLGSLAPFILSHYENPYIKNLVDENFRSFIRRSLLKYESRSVGVVGGFGYACREIFERICNEEGIAVREFAAQPIEKLIGYHTPVRAYDEMKL